MTIEEQQKRFRWLAWIVGIIVVIVALLPEITQDQEYHYFADDFMGGYGNVFSNIGFLIVGVWGLKIMWDQYKTPTAFASRAEIWPYATFFLGVFLTAWGSAYYHLIPDDAALFWDRLPMTISFMSLLTIVLAERVDLKLARWLFLPLLAIGIYSVLNWAVNNWLTGRGDLRLYALVQFLPMILILLIGRWFPSRYTKSGYIYVMFGLYAAAKLFEVLDWLTLTLSFDIVSGHELKHMLSAAATYVLIPNLKQRRPKAGVELAEMEE